MSNLVAEITILSYIENVMLWLLVLIEGNKQVDIKYNMNYTKCILVIKKDYYHRWIRENIIFFLK